MGTCERAYSSRHYDICPLLSIPLRYPGHSIPISHQIYYFLIVVWAEYPTGACISLIRLRLRDMHTTICHFPSYYGICGKLITPLRAVSVIIIRGRLSNTKYPLPFSNVASVNSPTDGLTGHVTTPMTTTWSQLLPPGMWPVTTPPDSVVLVP
jgi:hypothetical protein